MTLFLIKKASILVFMSETVSSPPELPLGVFTHIEKTGGISVRNSLERAMDGPGLYLYSPLADRFMEAEDGRPDTSPLFDVIKAGLAYPFLRTALIRLHDRHLSAVTDRIVETGSVGIPDEAKVILGHFQADQFDDEIQERPTVQAVVIREPLERARSHYDHWRRTRGNSDWRVLIPYDPRMSFEDFASLPDMQNFQSQALGQRELKDFDVVGLTEAATEFVSRFLRVLTQAKIISPDLSSAPSTKRYNRTPSNSLTHVETIHGNTLRYLQQINADDYDLYAQAIELSTRQQ